MEIFLCVEDEGYKDMDFSIPEEGNPGVSGTIYEFLMLIKYLCMDKDYLVNVFCFENNRYPFGCNCIKIENHEAIWKYPFKKKDILIVQSTLNKSFYNELEGKKVRTIIWAHNYLSGEMVEMFNRMNSVKRIVFVGQEQYDHYVGHDIINKSTYIYNMFEANNSKYYRKDKLEPIVTYTGSLIPAKGFHVLARVWKKIVKRVPEAQLYVVGSGKLYDQRNQLGEYGVAEDSYEKAFIKYIIEEDKIMPSVHFLGVCGREKVELYQRTLVGVMNPTGATETFGLSGVEMEACGIPIVTKKKYGLFDIVEDKKTGFLISSEKELEKKIVELLVDREKNHVMGEKAKSFVTEKFAPEIILPAWKQIFFEIDKNQEAKYRKPCCHFFNDYKWLMILNRRIKNVFPHFPSIIGLRSRRRNKSII